MECLAREVKEEMGLEITKIDEQPKYFLTTPIMDGQWWTDNVSYEVKVKNLNYVPLDECQRIQFFTKEETVKKIFTKCLRVFENV